MVTVGHSGRNTIRCSDGAGCDATHGLLLATHKMPQLGNTVVSGQEEGRHLFFS